MTSDKKIKDITFINADDNLINRLSVSVTLAQTGAKILEAGDGEEVMLFLEKLSSEKVIILLDLDMPVLNGYEVIKKIMAAPEKYKQVRIIVISGSFYADFQKKGLDKGISSYVEKPFSEQELLMKINTCAYEY